MKTVSNARQMIKISDQCQHIFYQPCVCAVGCEHTEYIALYDWPPWAIADGVVTSSTFVE